MVRPEKKKGYNHAAHTTGLLQDQYSEMTLPQASHQDKLKSEPTPCEVKQMKLPCGGSKKDGCLLFSHRVMSDSL